MLDSALLQSIICGICDAALAPDAWPGVLRQLTEYLGAVGAAYILTNKRTGQVEWISLAGPSAELQSDYVAHFAAVDPIGLCSTAARAGCGFRKASRERFSPGT